MGDKPCTVLLHYDKGEPPNVAELKSQIETGSLEDKIAALKKTILLLSNGEKLPQLLMSIIRFITPSKDHTLKKLLLIYWEVFEKKSADGKPLPELILVCNFLRNDLNHPNEYIRGSTLRYVCKMREPELIEPLIPSIKNNLEHRHSYVRRNAVLAIYSIYKDFDFLFPDAPEVIYNFLQQEGDSSCKRNAFLMLLHTAQEKAVEFLISVLDQVPNFSDTLQYVVLEVIRKVFRNSSSADRFKYIKCISALLGSSSTAIQFEAAGCLVQLSSAPPAIRAATSTFIDILCNQSDNNVKMIVLDKLLEIKRRHPKVLQDMLLDIMRALASPNMDIRKKTLDFALDLVSPRNIEEVISVLKKEINKTQSTEEDQGGDYRQILIQAIHGCAVRFPSVASNVVHVLMDFLGDSNTTSALDVILFVREVIETYPDLRAQLLRKLVQNFSQIKSSKVYRAALWIIGEYSYDPEDIDLSFNAIKSSLGEPPFLENVEVEETETKSAAPTTTNVSASRVLPDGTYASQSALVLETRTGKTDVRNLTTIRGLLLSGDFFLGSAVATTFTKFIFKLRQLPVKNPVKNAFSGEILLLLASMLRLGKSPQYKIDSDSYERIALSIHIISSPLLINDLVKTSYLNDCRHAFSAMLKEQQTAKLEADQKPKTVSVQADSVIKIRQLRNKKVYDTFDDEDLEDLSKATGSTEKESEEKRLNRVFQLTGFSDPLYAEAYVLVHQYDILLEVLVINQTGDTLQNVSLELATLGDLKLVERPQTYAIAPHDKRIIKANIKVSSTETGIIFGNIVYDIAGKPSSADKNIVILNDIHIDIMDYISPATCTDVQFRTMWAEFEWENKVAVNTNIKEVNDFLDHIIKSTNMKCLTQRSALEGDCGFLAANLYAKSIFGEDALANICIEKSEEKLSGYIRIRSKTQGIALSLGDKITLKQREQ